MNIGGRNVIHLNRDEKLLRDNRGKLLFLLIQAAIVR